MAAPTGAWDRSKFLKLLVSSAAYRQLSKVTPELAELDPENRLLARGPRFLPLTEAYIMHNGEPPFEHVVSVVIVNTAHLTQMVPLVTLA